MEVHVIGFFETGRRKIQNLPMGLFVRLGTRLRNAMLDGIIGLKDLTLLVCIAILVDIATKITPRDQFGYQLRWIDKKMFFNTMN